MRQAALAQGQDGEVGEAFLEGSSGLVARKS